MHREFCDYPCIETFIRRHDRLSAGTHLASLVHALRMSWPMGKTRWDSAFDDFRKTVEAMPESDGTGDVHAIVLNYKRPRNIEPIVLSLLRTPSIGAVTICNHHPDSSPSAFFPRPHPRVRIEHYPHGDAYRRYVIAAREPSRFFLSTDDDVFLRPTQIERLCNALRAQPAIPHGVCGQFRYSSGGFRSGIVRHEGTVDILNRVYAFTSDHASKIVAAHDAHWKDEKKCFWDDVLLSLVTREKPMCHDVGKILFCPTSRAPGIALCRQTDFVSKRKYAFDTLRA